MADKTSTAIRGTEISASGVTTSGVIAADRISVVFDETLSSSEAIDLLYKCKAQIEAFYLKR